MNNDLILIQDKINTHKYDLSVNLVNKNVAAKEDETLASLISKVKDIEQGGGSGGSGLDWSTVTDMSYAFYQNNVLFDFLWPTINCDMSQVKSWQWAFYKIINNEERDTMFQEKPIAFNIISPQQFNYCSYLTNVNFANEIKSNGFNNAFEGCVRLPISKIKELLGKINNEANNYSFSNAFVSVGSSLEEYDSLGDFEVNANNMTSMFSNMTKLKKVGNITNIYNSKCTTSTLFNGCSNLEEVGLITMQAMSTSYNMFNSCSKLVKINGFSVPSQKYQGEILTSSSYRFISNSSLTSLEECLNIPVGYFRYGGTNIGLSGTASSIKTLRRLTFCQSDEGYYTKNYAKNLPIQYCSFDRDGMLEVFNTIPDASDVTATSTITITGNPCVADGTLTEEDIAIATAKGYVVTTA